MSSLAEYFEKNRPKPIWHIGDRVYGKWNKIPFIGTVGNDNMINETDGPRVSIFLDLPIMHKNTRHNIIFVKQKDIKKLVSYDLEDTNGKQKSNTRAGAGSDQINNGASSKTARRTGTRKSLVDATTSRASKRNQQST